MPGEPKAPAEREFVPLQDVLLAYDDERVQRAFAELESGLLRDGLVGTFEDKLRVQQQLEKAPTHPVSAWSCGRGGFGERAFVRAVPAIKVFGDGP